MQSSSQIIKTIFSKRKYNTSKFSEKQSLVKDYKMSEEDIIELAMDLEEKINNPIGDEEIANWETVSDVIISIDKFSKSVDLDIEIG